METAITATNESFIANVITWHYDQLWMGQNSFGQDQKQLVSTEFCYQTHAQNNLDISITNLQRSKSF